VLALQVTGQAMEKVIVSHQTELSAVAHQSMLHLHPKSASLDETLRLAFCFVLSFLHEQLLSTRVIIQILV
jgi:hypothetical protein